MKKELKKMIIKKKSYLNYSKLKYKLNNTKGITLVALVITIIIIIILATVTINMAFGDNGLIRQASETRDRATNMVDDEGNNMNRLLQEYANVMAEDAEISVPETQKVPTTVIEAKESGTEFISKTTITDVLGNEITIPAGFKVSEDSGDTVQQGVVIEDVSASNDSAVQGSQYVWIPVGSFINDEGETKEVILGRYTFNTTDGTPTLVQAAFNEPETEEGGDGIPDDIPDYTNQSSSVVINSYYRELIDYREGVASSGTNGRNATAYDLAGFLESARDSGGYYIGRYEASYASGKGTVDYKAASKVSNGYSTSSMSYSQGTLWNFITQLNASKVSINTYAGSTSVTSDLINSYAWDTAIVYIQQAGNTNYANRKGTDINTSLTNTGANGDEVCKINDMASNVREWTTEYSSLTVDSSASPCVYRGGIYAVSNHYTAYRFGLNATYSSNEQRRRFSSHHLFRCLKSMVFT